MFNNFAPEEILNGGDNVAQPLDAVSIVQSEINNLPIKDVQSILSGMTGVNVGALAPFDAGNPFELVNGVSTVASSFPGGGIVSAAVSSVGFAKPGI